MADTTQSLDHLRALIAELRFKRYARRSGEVVCKGDHENLTGKCPVCKACV